MVAGRVKSGRRVRIGWTSPDRSAETFINKGTSSTEIRIEIPVPVSALPFGGFGIEAVMTGATQAVRNAQPFKEAAALICPENDTGSRGRFAISLQEAWVT